MNDLNMRKRESIVTCLKDRDPYYEKAYAIDKTRQRFIYLKSI